MVRVNGPSNRVESSVAGAMKANVSELVGCFIPSQNFWFYDSRALIFQMIEAISCDRKFMLNIGLTPDGELQPGGGKMCEDFGEFVRRNA